MVLQQVLHYKLLDTLTGNLVEGCGVVFSLPLTIINMNNSYLGD